MNNKSLLLLVLPLLFITGCKNNNTQTISNKEEYKMHLEKLVTGPWVSSTEKFNYDLKCYSGMTSDNTNHVYTVLIGYSTMEIKNIKIIMLPIGNIDNYATSNLATVGYTKSMNLTVQKDVEKNNYPQYKLQMEKKEAQSKVYLSVSYSTNQDLIEINF